MTAIPKPRPYDERKASRIDTSGMPHPKKHFVRDAGYRAEVRRHECALRGKGYGDCATRKVDCAHVGTGGMGIKTHDSLTAPLCSGPAGHHRQFDTYRLPRAARQLIARRAREIRAEWEKRQERRATR